MSYSRQQIPTRPASYPASTCPTGHIVSSISNMEQNYTNLLYCISEGLAKKKAFFLGSEAQLRSEDQRCFCISDISVE
jgi:hypothetical protein